MKHYRSLIPLAQDARKPIFSLAAGDGAFGSHAVAARGAFHDFKTLVENLLQRTNVRSTETAGNGVPIFAAPPDARSDVAAPDVELVNRLRDEEP